MQNETEQTSVKGMIQQMAGNGVSVIQGRVISASPLKVQAINDEKCIIYQNSLFVPRHLTNYTASCTISKGSDGSVNAPCSDGGSLTDFTLTGSITVNNALKAGEIVHLLSLNHGKQYYILDRV